MHNTAPDILPFALSSVWTHVEKLTAQQEEMERWKAEAESKMTRMEQEISDLRAALEKTR